MPRTTCEVPIFEDIGSWGFTAQACAQHLRGEGDRVEVLINSPGGEIFEGLGICAMLRGEKRPVRAIVMGCAASMASVIAAAAPETWMWDSAFMMLHNPQGMAWGEAEDLRKEAEVLDFLRDRVATIYSRGGKAKADWNAVMDGVSWLDAKACLELGLVDKIIPAPKEQPQARWSPAASAHLVSRGLSLLIAGRPAGAPASPSSGLHDRSRSTSSPRMERVLMPDAKRVSAILVCLSGALSLAQEGQGSDDPQEKELCAGLATSIAPAASAFQALLPVAEQPSAKITDLLALHETVHELTGEKTGQVGAVRALHRNAQTSALIGEKAQVAGLVEAMLRDGQIGPEERTHYLAYSLEDAKSSRRLLRKAPLREQPVDSAGGIDAEDRPETPKRDKNGKPEAKADASVVALIKQKQKGATT